MPSDNSKRPHSNTDGSRLTRVKIKCVRCGTRITAEIHHKRDLRIMVPPQAVVIMYEPHRCTTNYDYSDDEMRLMGALVFEAITTAKP